MIRITRERCLVCNSTYEDFVEHSEPRENKDDRVCPICSERIEETIEFMVERDEVTGGPDMSVFKQMTVEDWEKRFLDSNDKNVHAILRTALRRSFNFKYHPPYIFCYLSRKKI